jgi:hypothetical protein
MGVTDFDVQQYITHPPSFPGGGFPNVVYVADLRPDTSTRKHVVRIVNGQNLPAGGLTLVTPNPLYVLGHFNAHFTEVGTTNTSLSRPASLVGDSVTVLSGNWNDTNSASGLGARKAASTTLNAALLTGIVPTRSSNGWPCYSGGIENSLRLLEDWGGRTLNFNGSIVVPFASQIATEPWKLSGGAGGNVYLPPTRVFRFDPRLANPANMPPATPHLRTLIRTQWKLVAPGATG